MYFIKAQEMRQDWWRYPVVLIIAIIAYLFVGQVPLLIAIALQSQKGIPIDIIRFTETTDPSALGLSQNTGLALLLIPSALGFFALLLAILKIHKTRVGSIASASGKIRWKRMQEAAFLWLAFLVIAELVFYSINKDNYTFNFAGPQFFILFFIALLLIPFQAWFEELLFRGYLMQGIGLMFRIRLVALVLTSAGFGYLHIMNPEVKEFGLMGTMPYYIGFGLFTGLLVIMDNGIEMACGIHAVNNIYSAVFVTYQSSVLKTPALVSTKNLDPLVMNLGFAVMAILFLLLMAKRHGWNNWQRIYKRIPKPSENSVL